MIVAHNSLLKNAQTEMSVPPDGTDSSGKVGRTFLIVFLSGKDLLGIGPYQLPGHLTNPPLKSIIRNPFSQIIFKFWESESVRKGALSVEIERFAF